MWPKLSFLWALIFSIILDLKWSIVFFLIENFSLLKIIVKLDMLRGLKCYKQLANNNFLGKEQKREMTLTQFLLSGKIKVFWQTV